MIFKRDWRQIRDFLTGSTDLPIYWLYWFSLQRPSSVCTDYWFIPQML